MQIVEELFQAPLSYSIILEKSLKLFDYLIETPFIYKPNALQ